MYKILIALLAVALVATTMPFATAGPDDENGDSGQNEVAPIPHDVFVGGPGSRILAAIEYADLPLSDSQTLALQLLAGSLDVVDDGDGAWGVDAIVEACGGDAACGGTYTGNNSANTYFMGGNISGNACQNILIQTNLVLGDDNNVCYQSAESHVTYTTEDGGSCYQSASTQTGGACGTNAVPVSFTAFFTCRTEAGAWIHEGAICPGIK